MTAIATPTGRDGQRELATKASAQVPWRRLAWVTWRQHRAALTWTLLLSAVITAEMAVTGSQPPVARPTGLGGTVLLLQAIPLLLGVFLGAPLLARETENGTARLTWTQYASRTRWFLAKAVPIAALLAIAAVGVGFEFGWWVSSFRFPADSWPPETFNLQPLPFAGWVTLGFSLGVFLGEVVRRTVPAMAATLAGYAGLLYMTTAFWRMSYLPPLHRPVHVHISAGGGYGYGYGAAWRGPHAATPDVLGSSLGWPDGRLLSNAQISHHSSDWFGLHHIQLWITYQPASRYGLFQHIEFGWLIALSGILITATAVLIRRRAA